MNWGKFLSWRFVFFGLWDSESNEKASCLCRCSLSFLFLESSKFYGSGSRDINQKVHQKNLCRTVHSSYQKFFCSTPEGYAQLVQLRKTFRKNLRLLVFQPKHFRKSFQSPEIALGHNPIDFSVDLIFVGIFSKTTCQNFHVILAETFSKGVFLIVGTLRLQSELFFLIRSHFFTVEWYAIQLLVHHLCKKTFSLQVFAPKSFSLSTENFFHSSFGLFFQ